MTTCPRVALGTTRSGSGELWTEHPTVAVDLGNGVAGCVTLDKGWTYNRNWAEVKVEQEYVVYSPEFPQEQKGWQAILRLIATERSNAAAWEDKAKDAEARAQKVERERYFPPENFNGRKVFNEISVDPEDGPYWFIVHKPSSAAPSYSAAYVETCNGIDLTAEQALEAGRILISLARNWQSPTDRLEERRRDVSMQIWGKEFHELDEECQEFVTAAAERLIQKEDEDA